MGSTRCATVKLDVRDWTMEYEVGGLRTKRSSAEKTYNYIYSGDKLVRMTCGDNILDFTYDANGAPLTLVTGGKVYYYLTNLQGDVISVESSDGTSVASYCYDAWGKILSSSGDLAELNPLRYRGYVYDQETGFYYVESRYYDPAIRRFINADSTPSTGQDVSGTNMYAYCGNNPVSRVDDGGEVWHLVVGAAVGVATQYAADVSINLLSGKSLRDALTQTSSIVDYTSAAIGGVLAASGIGLAGSVVANATLGGATYLMNSNVGGKSINDLDLVVATVIGGVAGVIGGSGANGARLQGVYKTSKTVLKTAVSTTKRAMYTGKITAVKSAVTVSTIRTVASGFFSNITNLVRKAFTRSAT